MEGIISKVSKRIFIIFGYEFPYAKASTNYIRCLAQALALYNEYEIIVIGAQRKKDKCESRCGTLGNIKYENITFRECQVPFRLRDHFLYGKVLEKSLKKYNIATDDYVILYNDYFSVSKMMLREYRKMVQEGHVLYCVVEWFQPYQYKFGVLHPAYILWKYNFEHYIPKFRKIIPISEFLANHFCKLGCKCLTMPCLSDTCSRKCELSDCVKQKEYNITYVGSFVKKDAICEMVQSLTFLSDDELKRIRFHFTAIGLDTLKHHCGISSEQWERIKNSIISHGWMSYEDLLYFYTQMDFLFLARTKNVMTLSNFPSKVPEMMGYGVIPVCSRVGDYTDCYLTDGYDSIIFDGCTPEACASALKRVMRIERNDLISMKKNARMTAEEKFDYHNWTDKIIKFIQEEV